MIVEHHPGSLAPLEVLVRAQLLRAASEAEPTYQFKHTLTQETAYQSLLQRRRREIHARVAAAYESLYPNSLEEVAPILSLHFAQAGDDAKTQRYAVLAGDAAARVYAHAEAEMQYRVALEAARRSAGRGPEERAALQEIYLKRGRALELGNRYIEALANYQELEHAAVELGDRAMELAALLARALIVSLPSRVADFAQGMEAAGRALTLAREIGDPGGEARALWILMLLGYFTSELAAGIRYGEQSIELARRFNLREQLAYSLNDIGRVYIGEGDIGRALETQEEARALWRELGNQPLLTDNLVNSASCHITLGQWVEATRLLDEAQAIAQPIGNTWGLAYVLMTRSYIYLLRGEVTQGLAAAEECIRVGTEAGALFAIPSGYQMQSWVYAEMGLADRAVELARGMVSEMDRFFRLFLPMANAVLAHALLARGDLDGAQAQVELSKQNFHPDDYDGFQPSFVLTVEGRVALARGDLERALRVIDDLLASSRRVGLRVFVAEPLYWKARVHLAMGEREPALAALEEGCTLAEATGERPALLHLLSLRAELEAERGAVDAARALRAEARALRDALLIDTPPDLHAAFLALPEVRAIAEGRG